MAQNLVLNKNNETFCWKVSTSVCEWLPILHMIDLINPNITGSQIETFRKANVRILRTQNNEKANQILCKQCDL